MGGKKKDNAKKKKKAPLKCSDQSRGGGGAGAAGWWGCRGRDDDGVGCASESVAASSTFPSLPGLVRAVTPATNPACSRLLFLVSEAEVGDGHRAAPDPAEASLSPSLFYSPLPCVLPGQAGRKPPAPRGAARGGTSGRPRRKHLERPRRIPRRSQLDGPAAAGLAQAGSKTPRRGRRKGEEEAAKEQGGAGKGSPSLPSPGCGKGGQSPRHRAGSAGWRKGGRRRGRGGGCLVFLGDRTTTAPSLP